MVATRSFVTSMVVVALAFLALSTPPAGAEDKVPVLVGTNPESPGVSIHPLVYGRVNGAITSSLPGVSRLQAFTSGVGGPTVRLYADSECEGTPLASGSGEQFEAQGIEITVPSNAATTVYADETDGVDTSGCSSGLSYKQVSAPPGAPTVSSVNPASPANDNLPLVGGSAEEGATVGLYDNAACSGTPLATGPTATFEGPGIAAPVPDNSTITFYAAASWAGMSSACSSTSVFYEEVSPVVEESVGSEEGESFEVGDSGGRSAGGDSQVPAASPAVSTARPVTPKLRVLSGVLGHSSTPMLTGSAEGAAQVAIYGQPGCKGSAMAHSTAAQFGSGVQVTVPENATTQFYAASMSASGIFSECSTEAVSYTEDSLPPATRFTFGPGVKTRKDKVVFRFADVAEGPPGTAFTCKVDRKPWRACASPLHVKKLHRGKHVVKVRATDAAGNRQKKPSVRRFKVIG